MVFERQSRLKGSGVGALPRNSLPSTAATTATTSTAAGAAATTGAAAATIGAASSTSQPHQQSQLPPKPPASSASASSMLVGNNTVTNKGLVTASLGLRSLLGSARASSIFLDNDSLILPSEHEDDDDDDDDDGMSEADSSLNLSLHTMGGGYGTSSAASIGGSSVLTVANTVTEDTSTMTSTGASAAMVEAELRGFGGEEENVNTMTTPRQQQQATTGNTTGGTTTSAPKSSSTGVRSWMTKTPTITRSINNNSSNNHTPMNGNRKVANMDASQAETPAASGSRPSTQQQQSNATPVTAAPTSAPTTPAATVANDDDLKIVATASMITLDSNSPSASTNSNMKSSTTTPRKNILPNGPIAAAAAATDSLLAPPSPAVEDDNYDHKINHDSSGDGMILPNASYYNSSKPMSTFCQYGPRWLKFLLIISIVFLLASIALVAVGVSMQYVEIGWANSKSAGATSSAVISTPVDTTAVVDPTTTSQEDQSSSGGDSSEPVIPTGGDDSTANDGEAFNLTNAIASMPTQDEEETDSETLASTTSESSNSTETSPWDDSSSSVANTTNSNTTTPTLAPTQTDAPSDTPSTPPSPMPTPRPSVAPSDSPSHLPTFSPSTSAPSSMPTATMQPSSLQPALVAPELHRPTVSEAPSDSPTTTSELLFDMVTFYVLAGQWDENQSEMTLRGEDWLLESLPTQQNNSSAAAFMVHLGDWNGPVGVAADREYEMATAVDGDILPAALDCSEQAFIQTHIDFSKCSVPVYFTLGSREFGDCPDPEAALTSYRTWLQDYDLRYWDSPQWDVWNDGSSGYQENWIFSFNEVVFAAINLARGDGASSRDATSSFMDDTDWAIRYDATMDWINMNYYDFRRFNRVFCIFANSGPEDRTNRDFYEELLSRIEFRWIRMHFVIVHRNMPDEEVEAYSRRYDGIRNLDVISVQASVWPPMRVEIDLSNIIRAEINVDQLTWFDEYVELESM